MKKNIGTADKIIRILLTIAIAVLYHKGIIEGFGGLLLLVVAGVLLGTAIISICPLYTLLGINTAGKVETRNR